MRNIEAVIASLLGMLIILPGAAWAACAYESGESKDTKTINFGTVTVQRDTPLGAVLSTKSVSFQSGSYICSSTYNITGNIGKFKIFSSYGKNVYSTNIAGVGLLLEYIFHETTYPYPFTFQYGQGNWYHYGVVNASLIKTSVGSTGSGTLTPGTLAFDNADTLRLFDLNLTGINNIVPVACSVTNTAINVPMGNVQRSTFTGVGYIASPVQFLIPLNCDAGTRVNLRLDATTDSSGVPGVMAINSSATGNAASGVGIKITRDGAPVTFGETVPVGVMANSGTYNIPFVAQYYQTSPNVKAGLANGTATFTMTYN
ncbi:fimbrial protein [Pseudomonas sp. ADAK2]|uniref:fimbrial protein n=1 Tax=unclassified Pseudomonas TaxID=196821 RepID=UPI001463CC73|nr:MULTISPECIES: fimbrial protein [unclassified Pseudomonas]QJI40168.1 fimbrial protein [Pseudomonas sp. ADAK7]QJI46473.1 fimbrial protein [Pseudomonas sp. ADAK2]